MNQYSKISDVDLEKELLIVAAESDSRYYQNATNLGDDEKVDQHYQHPTQKNHKMSTFEVNQQPTQNELEMSKIDVNQQLTQKKPKSSKLEENQQPVPSQIPHAETTSNGYANIVATHYNTLEEKGLDERSKSRIFHMRNFHNWIKSMLINEYLGKVKEGMRHNAPLRVHDMCSGKGGDLLKWRKGGITHLICSDIASVSLEQCKMRYDHMKERAGRERGGSHSVYTIEYIAADCSRVRLREKYKDPSMKVDLVSCQFAFHYSFESLPQAECMLRNAAECLRPGGYFIGTIPDANDLIARARRDGGDTYGNNVYRVTLDFDVNKPPPLFGAKYNFNLDGVVDCPEFLVHFPTLVKLAKKFGLKLVKKEKFYEYYERMKDEGRQLLYNMKSLEAYPPHESAHLSGNDPEDYAHAREYARDKDFKIGTLSKSEWEASSIYTTFIFEKVKNTWNTDGTPLYDI